MNTPWDSVLKKLVKSGLVPNPLYRILLWGPPRTGKSSIAGRGLFNPLHVERVTLHKQQPVDDLLGGYALIDGTTKWQHGPAVRALNNGHCLVLDEIDQHSPECRCILHALLDDPPAVTLASGDRIHGANGYSVIATTNAPPSSLPAPVYDRFDIVLRADTLAEGLAHQLGNLSHQAQRVVSHSVSNEWQRPATVNLFIAVAKLRRIGMGDEEIVNALGLTGRAATDCLLALR